MKRLAHRLTPEAITVIVLQLLSVFSLVFLTSLIAKPKLLFGRSLSAIAPSLFPTVIIAAIAVLCAILLVALLSTDQDTNSAEERFSRSQWLRGSGFFAILIVYALTMVPFGFFISSVIAITMMSVLMGSRSLVQTTLLAIAGPVLLYLAATRLLAVSLPELNSIELFYARVLGG